MSEAKWAQEDLRSEEPVRAPLPPPAAAAPAFDWLEARRRLELAADVAIIAAPPHLESRGPRRWLQTFLARVVIRLTRFITSRQADYNVCLLETARDVVEALHEVERQADENQQRIQQLESCLARLQTRTGPGAGRPVRSAG
jgi:hypothetical protein